MKKYEEYSPDLYSDDRNWQVIINDQLDSWWENKSEAIDRIVETVDLDGDRDKGLKGYNYDGSEMSLEEIKYQLDGEAEEDFYAVLEDIKSYSKCSDDIRLYNISDDTEIEFQKDDDDDFYFED